MDWTSAGEQRLTYLWNIAKWSSAKIAADLGCTKNAVIGKARRLSLDPRESGGGTKGTKRRGFPKLIISNIPREDIAPVPGTFKHFSDMQDHDCRWPAGSHAMHCASVRVENSPYCAAHTVLAYKPREAKK